jgi:hypothetical protein
MITNCPYPGLRPFHRDETDIFFGREEQTDQLLEKLSESHFLSVIGASGCGKSSLVKAGLIGSLEAGFMAEAGARWQFAVLRPGSHPLKRLAKAVLTAMDSKEPEEEVLAYVCATLRRGPLGLVEVLQEKPLPEKTNLLVLVDQFEEIFRFRKEGHFDEADAFVSLLIGSARQSEFPIYVVITMRSDFLGECAIFEELPKVINESQFLTPRLTREQSRAAIEGPARVFGGHVEARLVNNLLNDMGNDPDQLPLLQHLLMRIWTKKQAESGGAAPEDIVLTPEDYKAAGGFKNSLSNHANETFDQLTPEQKKIAETIFRCLSERSIGKKDTRRPTPLEEISSVAGHFEENVSSEQKEKNQESVKQVIDIFRQPECSFLTPVYTENLYPETMIDIGHESLIRQWDRMNNWVDQEAKSADQYLFLEKTAKRWKEEEASLWDTPDLEYAREWKKREQPTKDWAKRYGEDFELAMKFLEESEEKQKQRLADEEKVRRDKYRKILIQRNKNLVIATFVIFFVVAILLFIWSQVLSHERKNILTGLNYHFHNGIAKVFNGDKYGFINEDGDTLCAYKYDQAEDFVDFIEISNAQIANTFYTLDFFEGRIREFPTITITNSPQVFDTTTAEAIEIKWESAIGPDNATLSQRKINSFERFFNRKQSYLDYLTRDHLKHLTLIDNNLNSVPAQIGDLTNLRYIKISDTQIDSISKVIGKLKSIYALDLSNNKIRYLTNELDGLSKLKYLNLSNNKLVELPPNIWKLKELKVLDLSNNELGSIPTDIGNLTKLEYLNLANTKLEELPSSLWKLKELKVLDLSNNMLDSLSNEIYKLTQLESLNLTYNPCALGNKENKKIPKDIQKKLPKLKGDYIDETKTKIINKDNPEDKVEENDSDKRESPR